MDTPIEYLLNAKTKKYRNLLERTKNDIRKTLKKYKNVSVSFSGGKDSTVLLDLVGRERDDIIVLFIESGATFPDTTDLIKSYSEKYKVIIVPSSYTYQEIYKMREKKDISNARWMEWIVYEPVRKFVADYQIDLQCIGLRAKESKRRQMRFRVYPHERIQQATGVGTFYPLKDWSYADVWTYIFDNRLPYNKLYDRWRSIGVSDSRSRVDSYLECEGHNNQTLELLEKFWPDIYITVKNNHREFI